MKKLLLLLFMFAGLNVFGQTENFEGATFPPTTPANWATFETGTGSGQSWGETSLAAFTYGGVGKSALLNRENVTDGTFAIDWMVTNLITVPANGQLRFFTKTVQSGNQGSLFDIKISTTSQTNPASFTNLVSWDESSLTTTANVYEEKVVDLAASYPAGTQIYIAFVMTNDNGDRWLIDNMNVVQKCNAPIGPLATANESTSTANLSWGTPPGITQWELEVIPFADPFLGNVTHNATTNVNFLATGLLANTLYKFQVRSVCTGGFESDWFGPRSFQTASFGDTCAGPIVVGGLVGPTFVPGLLPYVTMDNTANYLDTNDITQPITCSGSATNYMQGNDVFYSFTPTFTGNVAIMLSPTNANSSIHVYSACPGSPGATCLAGVANGNSLPRNINPFPVVAGTTYYIIISSSSGTVGYTLTIQQAFCNQPTALTATNITTTSADLSWTDVPGTTSWQVALAPAPFGLPTGPGVTTTNPYLATSLIPGVVYQYYVRSDCNNGNFSIWSGPFTFTLPQVATALNFTDGFETLTGWTLTNNNTQPNVWAVGTGINNGGTHALYVTDTNGTTNTYNTTAGSTAHAYKDFIIPAGATQLDFTFDWRSNGEAVNDYLRVWTVPTSTVITAGTQIPILPAAPNKIKVGNDLVSNSNFTTQNYTLNATPYAGGTMRVVFEWKNNTTLGNQPPAAIDNVKLDLITCPKPDNLVFSNIIYNAAQLTWTNGATESQWEVLVLPAGSPAPTAGSVGTITNFASPYQITGLTSVTCYDVYVRARCSATEFSFWSVKGSFCTTPNYCAGDHFYDNGGATGNYTNSQNIVSTVCPTNPGDIVTVVFNSFDVAAGDSLVIRDGGLVTSPVIGTYTGTNLPPSFSATSASGCLTFVFTSNASVVSAGWDATIYCTPPITCPKPTSVIVSNITASSIDLSWTESGTATGWQVLVLPAGSNVPVFTATGSSFSTTTITFPGLLPSTAYTVYVRAICSSSDKSFWTDGINFSTTPINDNCINAIQAVVNTDLECTNPNYVDLKGATPSITTGSCNANANDTWYKFTATSTTHTVQMEGPTGLMGSIDMALYSGSCSSLTLIQCGTTATVQGPTVVGNAIEGHVANGLTIGQTYYIRLITNASTATSNPFKLCIGSVSCSGADPLCAGVTYTNSTDVINFGNYQCLGTSPNVKFFFIQAGVTGTYTCNISQTSGDVDYALWGPYATKQIGCNDVPNQTPVRCSFSAAAVENFTLPVIAGEFYILMVTNYANDPGTISIVTNQPIPTCYNADFHYSAPTYCKDESPASPIFVSGGSAGTFTSSPAGLSINPSTGVINFAASTGGTYVVTNTVIPNNLPPYTNDPIEHSVLVTVTQPADATITYANNAIFCNSDANTYPVIVTGNSGPNPYFSATPTGLQYALDPISGNLNPSLAQPGIYTVTMTIPANGGCDLYTTTKTVEILVSPVLPYKQDVNACNSYILPALTVGNYFTTTGGVGPLNAGDVITTNQTIYVYASNGICSSEVLFKVNIISIPTPTFDYLTQPTCAIQTGSINITAPVAVGGTVPTNLFISEVTDASTGILTYVELFNGTGAPINLSGYRLKMYTTGGGLPYSLPCDNALSGTIANNSTFVIKINNAANIPGVTPNLTLNTCTQGVNENDNIKLTTSANVVVDNWGATNGSTFTPSGQSGYTYRRLASATSLPSATWNPADWSTTDPENYSNLGQYILNASSYEYSVDNGPYQTNTTFTGLTPGSHSFIVHDLINNCYSAPISFTMNAVPYTTAVTDFTYTTPVCITSTTNPTPALAAGFTSGGTFSYVGTGLDLNATTGIITLATSTAGTYVVTYTYPEDLANCIHTNSSNFTITIDPFVTATFTQIANICQNATAPTLLATSNNNITGIWSPATINTSTAGMTTYTFTPNPGQCGVGTTMNITIDPIIVPTFPAIASICLNGTAPALLTTSINGITGVWNPSAINTASVGTSTYQFTPDAGQCSQVVTISVTINPSTTPSFTPVETLCVGDANVTLPTTSNNSIEGSWSPAVVNTSIDGSIVYTFTPDPSECASITTMTVKVELCDIQKGISPNGDNKNDYLKLVANKVEIFNRYGKEVYSKTNYNNDWHGQFMG
ncbi:fibronectin type III domain-containing protein, partial [Flavobacterium terrigena]